MTLEQLARQGRRAATLTTAATISSKMSQIRKESIKQAFSDFENVRYRYEFVACVDGVSYYDDSAASSVEATWFTLDNLNIPVILITYGSNEDCDELIPQVRKYVTDVICIGNNNDRFHKIFEPMLKDKIYDCQSLEEAIVIASKIAKNGDNVLFSPAVSINNIQRVDLYQSCVHSLSGK